MVNFTNFVEFFFGVDNGVACFQRIIDKIIKENNSTGVYAYVDNIVVVGKNQQELDENLEKFKKITTQYSLTLNEDKSAFSKTAIDFLGYNISQGLLRPDAERLRPLRELPIPQNKTSLHRVLGLFSYYSQWIPKFSDKIRPLITANSFPVDSESIKTLENFKEEIEKALLHSVDENIPLVVEIDASDTAIAATLNQANHPVAFFSSTLTTTEQKHSSVEKEACAIVESVKKWSHYLSARRFVIATDQQAVNFMFDTRRHGKIKNSKIERWRMELGCYEYVIMYRPGKNNISADMLLCAQCNALNNMGRLHEIHENLCHPGITRLVHFVKVRNLPYSIEEVKRVCAAYAVCARWKPHFYTLEAGHLVKATQSMEQLNIDFKGPLPLTSKNHYLLMVIDEYLRFPFAFACTSTNTDSVIQSLNQIFIVFGMPSYIHSDRGTSFLSKEVREYLTNLRIATSQTTPYHPQGNDQCEQYNGIIWKHTLLTLASRNLKELQ